MTEHVLALADEARRMSLVAELWRLRWKLTISQLDALLRTAEYGEDLAAITVDDLVGADRDAPALVIRKSESVEDAVMRVFLGRPENWRSSSFFSHHMGLQRWDAQALLTDLAKRGQLVRTGKTSGTRYRLASDSADTEGGVDG